MAPQEIYFDNNATTPTLPVVREAMMEALELGYGNASSAHSAGERSRQILRDAREKVADIIGAIPDHICFTSGGTEANNLALLSVLSAPGGCRRVVTTSFEHSSVLKTCEFLEANGAEVVYLKPDRTGLIDPDQVAEALQESPTALISIQWVNNETGVIQQIEKIAEKCKSFTVIFHCDAAQAIGKIPIEVNGLPIDLLSMTAHKLHGPQGVGALYIRDRRFIQQVIHGGPQESNLRAGTENLVGIAGFAAAAEHRTRGMRKAVAKMSNLRDSFEKSLFESVPEVVINGDSKSRVCNSTNLRFAGVDGQALVAQLDAAGIRCSQSSACTNQRPEPSYVLREMGLSENEAYESVRFSYSELNSGAEVSKAIGEITRIVKKLRELAPIAQSVLPRKVAS